MQDKYKLEKEIYNQEKVKSGTKKWGYFWDSELLNVIRERYNNQLKEWGAEFLKDKKILIIGAGRANVKFCYQFSQDITAIDISDRQIEEITEIFPNLNSIVGDVTQYPYPENYYDVIFCPSILHHLTDDLEGLSPKFYKTLKSEGIIFIYSEPLLLNPMLILGRKFFPSQYHTPNEHPFISWKFKRIFSPHFKVASQKYQFLFTLFLAVFAKLSKLNNFNLIKIIFYKINTLFYYLDNILSKTFLKEFFWYFSMILKKNK